MTDKEDDDLNIPTFLKREPSPRKEVTPMSTKTDAGVKLAPKPVQAAKPVKATAKPASPMQAPDKPPRAAGKAPIPLDDYGYRQSSVKSKAAAMYAAKSGATIAEVKAATGSVQLNVLKELEGKGWKITRQKEGGEGKREITRYFLASK